MKAQSYTLDLILAVIFTAIIAVIVVLIIQQPPAIQQQQVDAKALSSTILLAYPVPYDETTVLSPGFVLDGRLNTSLFAQFEALPEPLIKQLSGIQSEFFINITASDGLALTTGTPPVHPTDVHVVRRYVAHNGTIATIEVVAWR